MRSAILFSMSARCAGVEAFQDGAAAQAASSAASMSSAVPRPTSAKALPVTGVMSSKYWPLTGGVHFPPMKCS